MSTVLIVGALGVVGADAAPTAPSAPPGSAVASNLAPGTAGMTLRSGSAALIAPSTAAEAPSGSNQQSPAPNPASDLIQGSGPIMKNPVIYNVFWLPTGRHYEGDGLASSDTRYENLLNRFAADVGGNDFYNIVTQYPGSNGTPANAVTFGGSWVDTAAYPHAGSQADPIFDADIQAVATLAASTNGWTKDINHIYLVYTAFNIFQCQTASSDCNFFKPGHTNAYCAYHFFFGADPVIYSFMGNDAMSGNPGGCSNGAAPNGDASADAEISTASHEFIEAVTDPKIDNWLTSVATGQQEIGDLCNRSDGPRNTSAPGADVYLGGNPYAVQQEWSNAVHGCAMDLNGAKNSDVPPILTLAKTGDAAAISGRQFQYSISASNPSNTDAATLVTVKDTLPSGVAYVAGSASPPPSSVIGQTLTWSLGTLAVHDSTVIMFKATAAVGTFHNCATVTYDDMLQIAAQPGQTGCADTSVTPPPCTQTRTGDISGPLVVNSGDSLCLNSGARVIGPVTVNAGGALTLTSASVSRGITSNGAVFIQICGSKVSPPAVGPAVNITNGTGSVIVGDPAASCSANQMSGGVNVSGNAAAVILGSNKVTRDMTVNNNTGPVTIKANTIVSGSLGCAGNAPPPGYAGQLNTASGGKTDQCAGL